MLRAAEYKSRIYFSSKKKKTRMKVGMELGMYLGVPTINGRSSKREYQYLVDKVNGKLAGWKSKTLSLAGLIQSALSTIPLYTMQTTKLPLVMKLIGSYGVTRNVCILCLGVRLRRQKVKVDLDGANITRLSWLS